MDSKRIMLDIVDYLTLAVKSVIRQYNTNRDSEQFTDSVKQVSRGKVGWLDPRVCWATPIVLSNRRKLPVELEKKK